jgi:hypothetical protein
MLALILSLATLLPTPQDPQSQPAPVPAPKAQEPADPKPAAQEPAVQSPTTAPVKVKAKRKGNSESLVRSLALSIDWLAAQQQEDGRWRSLEAENGGKGNKALDVGVTGLALLALLSEGHTLDHGKHKAGVAKGIQWLLEQQDKRTGLLGPSGSLYASYNHALATWALVEEYAASKDKKHKAEIQKALLQHERRRNPYKVWRYYPRDGDNDSSITGWMMLGLLAAERCGLAEIKAAKQAALSWYEEVTDPATGRVGYTRRGEGSSRNENNKAQFPAEASEALTALSVLIQLRCGKKAEQKPTVQFGLERILDLPPRWSPEKGNIDLYYWFFGSMALAESGNHDARKWNSMLIPTLNKSQIKTGKQTGSWDPIDPWSNIGGRTYMSALAVLSLSAATGKSRLLAR